MASLATTPQVEEKVSTRPQAAVRSLRILFGANCPRSTQTGIGNHLESLAAALERRGHRVEFLLREDFPAAATAGRWSRVVFPYQLAREVRRRAQNGQRYDVVNIHEPCGMFYAALREWSAELPPLVVTTHGVEQRAWELRVYDAKPSLKTRLVYPLTELRQANYSLRHADAAVCLSNEDAQYLERRIGVPAERIHRLPNGVNPALLSVERRPSNNPGLLFIGSWLHRKGTTQLAQAFHELRRHYPWLTLTVLGAGRAEPVLNSFSPVDRSAVNVVEKVSREELPGHLAQEQIFVLPSHFEGMPLSLLEAMAAGLPCVTTATCGMLDLIEDGRSGFLIPPGDSMALVERVTRLLESAELRRKLGDGARETARRRTWDDVAAQWEAMFHRVVRQQPRRYILRDRCWSDALKREPQDRLAENLMELSGELRRTGDLCEGMKAFSHAQIHGRVLDLGCGTGWKSYCLGRENGNWVVGCDHDLRLLQYGRREFDVHKLLQCDAARLPFSRDSFDWVIAVEVVEHLQNPRQFLEEVEYVLRPGGRLLLTTPNRLQYLRPWHPHWFYLGLRRRIVIEPSHVREYDAGELRRLLPEGLRPAQLRFLGTVIGRPLRLEVHKVPGPLRRLWAQGLELIAEKKSRGESLRNCDSES